MMLAATRTWVFFSAWLVGAGWCLSALHQLNRIGYACFLLLGLGVIIAARRCFQAGAGKFRLPRPRFRRAAPRLFLLLALLSLVSGISYAGLNWDANAYRLPRIMHWLGAGQWHWIHSADLRVNVAGCGFEWLAAPLVLFTGSDRLLFLINWIPYLLLPGLVFSVFTRLQVRPRVAWWWMWFVPAGWCFALEAGSIANDGFAAVYALAAVDLALRARVTGQAADLWLSMLAAALVTGVKQTSAPLAALWLVAAFPCWRLACRYPLAAAGAAVLAALVSILPVTVANLVHTRSLLPLDYAGLGNFKLNPFWGVAGNAIAIPAQNLLPPFYHLLPPFTVNWGPIAIAMQANFLHSDFGRHFAGFENFLLLSHGSGITEENAGLGLGVCALLLVAVLRARRNAGAGPVVPQDRQLWWLRLLPYGLLVIFMAKVGNYQNARQLAPYYPFLLPALLVQPGHLRVVGWRVWRWLGGAVMVLTAIMIVTLVDRPLFPAARMFQWLSAQYPSSAVLWKEWDIYQNSYFRTFELRRAALRQLPARPEPVVGFYARNNGADEFTAWLPLDGHRVERVSPDDTPETLARAAVHSVIVSDLTLQETGETAAGWAARFHATLLDGFPRQPGGDAIPAGCMFYLFRLDPPL